MLQFHLQLMPDTSGCSTELLIDSLIPVDTLTVHKLVNMEKKTTPQQACSWLFSWHAVPPSGHKHCRLFLQRLFFGSLGGSCSYIRVVKMGPPESILKTAVVLEAQKPQGDCIQIEIRRVFFTCMTTTFYFSPYICVALKTFKQISDALQSPGRSLISLLLQMADFIFSVLQKIIHFVYVQCICLPLYSFLPMSVDKHKIVL